MLGDTPVVIRRTHRRKAVAGAGARLQEQPFREARSLRLFRHGRGVDIVSVLVVEHEDRFPQFRLRR
jgi:hypothetical protein